ncbi:MAG: FG-GAP repeat protein [Euryarchaeota archaeon]|nr:FG-GAP repeat protein [Euryarchaeota archaeon]
MERKKDKRFTEDFVEKWSRSSEPAQEDQTENVLRRQDQLLKKDPKNARVWFARALILSDIGQYVQALTCVNKAEELDPTIDGIFPAKANLLSRLNRYREAAQYFKKGLDSKAGAVAPQIAARLTEKKASEELLRELVSEFGGRLKAGASSGESAAIAELMTVEGVGRLKAKALYDAGYRSIKDLRAAAEADLQAMKGIGDRSGGLILKAAQKAPVKGQDIDEKDCPLCGIILPSTDMDCYSCGMTFEDRSKAVALEKRLTDAEMRLTANPKDFPAWFEKGAVLKEMGKPREALAAMNEVTKGEPSYPGVWDVKGDLFKELGEEKIASSCYKRAAEEKAKREREAEEKSFLSELEKIVVAAPKDDWLAEQRKTQDELMRLADKDLDGDLGKGPDVSPEEEVKIEKSTYDISRPLPKKEKPERPLKASEEESLERIFTERKREIESKPPAPEPKRGPGLTNGLRRGREAGLTNGLRRGREAGLTNGLRRGREAGLTNGLGGRTNGLTNGTSRGRTNGLTNGAGGAESLTTVGFVNGLGSADFGSFGVTNGLTNGFGLTNGLGGHKFQREARRNRWKLYVIPIVMFSIMLVPLLTTVTTTVEGPLLLVQIDGGFDDWQSVAKFSASPEPAAINPNIDIISTAAFDNGGKYLAVYVRVAGDMLAGQPVSTDGLVDKVRIFFDGDGSRTTGYEIEGIGADLMIEVQGWRQGVSSASLYRHQGSDCWAWSGFSQASTVSARVSGSMLETELDWTLVSNRNATKVLVAAQCWDDSQDVSEFIIAPGGSALQVIQSGAAANAISGAARLSTVELMGGAGGADVSALSFALNGTAGAPSGLKLARSNGMDIASATPSGGVVSFSFPPITINEGEVQTWFLEADVGSLAPGGTLSASIERPEQVGTSAVAHLVTSSRRFSYVSAPPSTPSIDGGFAEWGNAHSDPADDARHGVDVTGYGALAAGAGLDLYAKVDNEILGGEAVPTNVTERVSGSTQPSPTTVGDSDRDGVPDNVDPMASDFNNDGLNDAGSVVSINGIVYPDVDSDGVPDYPRVASGGITDYWLNTTIPGSFPAAYAGRFASVYIGHVERPIVTGEDTLRFFVDDGSAGGYSYAGMGADYLVEFSGKYGRVRSSRYMQFTGASPGAWGWQEIPGALSFAYDMTALEASVPLASAAMVAVECSGWDQQDTTDGGGLVNSTRMTRAVNSDDIINANSMFTLNEVTTGYGAAASDQFGWNVSWAGDVNGDGRDDVIVGAPGNNSGRGAAYIFFGYTGFNSFQGKYINPLNANVTINGTTVNGHFGWDVSGGGNINGDIYNDFIIGEPDNGAGYAYIFYGQAWSSPPYFLTSASASRTESGETSGDKFGASVDVGVDMSDDGQDDPIVGAYARSTTRGKTYVIPSEGSRTSLRISGTYNYSKDENPNLSIPDASLTGATSTLSITDAGTIASLRVYLHITHTYISDLVINLTHPDGTLITLFGRTDSSSDNIYGWYSGRTFTSQASGNEQPIANLNLYVGKYSNGNWILKVHDALAGDTGTIDEWSVEISFGYPTAPYYGERSNNAHGFSVSGAGDFNKDTYKDIIVGAPQHTSNEGKAYVYYGNSVRGDPKSAQYNYTSGGGTNKRYWYVSSASAFNTATLSQGTETVGTSYNYIAYSDGSSTVLNSANAITWRFEYNVNENPELMETIFFESVAYNAVSVTHRLYIWNVASSTWEVLESKASNTYTLSPLGGSVSSGLNDYFNATGKINFCIHRVSRALAAQFGPDSVFLNVKYRDGVVLNGTTSSSFGLSVAGVGNANADGTGYDDVVVGAPDDTTNTGAVKFFAGGAYASGRSITYAAADATFTGQASGDKFGFSVNSAGNIGLGLPSDTGIPDIIIGAPFRDNGTADSGTVYVFNGSTSLTGSISASSADYMRNGSQAGCHFGWSVCKAGDFNVEGHNDIIVGAPDWTNTTNSWNYAGWTQILSVIIPEFGHLVTALMPVALVLPIAYRRRRRRASGAPREG